MPSVAPPKRFNWNRVLGLALPIVLILVCGVWLLLKLGSNIGGTGVAIGVSAAILPVPFLVAAFMWLDRYEPEPTPYLVFCLMWGAFVATLGALYANTAMSHLFERWNLPDNLVAVIVAPVVEESMKALGPLLLIAFTIWKKRRTVNGIIDAIVFFGLSAAGFAFSENILYIGGYGYDAGAEHGGVAGGLRGVVGIFLVRIPLSGFAHPLFTSMTAIGVGVAIRSTNRSVKIIAPFAGWLGAMVLHGSWNLMSVAAGATHSTQYLLYGYFSLFVPIFLAVLAFVMWLRSAEGRLPGTALTPYVRAGWVSPPEVASLGSIARRRSARAWAERVAGKPGQSGMRGFQLAATQLALLRDRIDRHLAAHGTPSAADLADEQQLLALMMAYRSAYVGRDPATPRATWDGSRYHIVFPDGVVRSVDEPATPVVPVPVPLIPVMPVAPPPYPYFPR
jgi:RsiW-degrading membrane proteinase PrsW (M82 family)